MYLLTLFKQSSLSTTTDDNSSPRVLVVNPASKQKRQQAISNKKKPGVWDKVASAAIDAGAFNSVPFPPTQSKTPWSGTSTPRTNSDGDLQQLFPALPSAGPSRRAELDNLLRKSNRNAWGESSVATSESEFSSDNNNDTINRKKKGKKGKQVLFRVGL
jgi:hypothetical protein